MQLPKVLRTGTVGKMVETVQREATKPENRQKMKDAVNQVKNRRRGSGGHHGTTPPPAV